MRFTWKIQKNETLRRFLQRMLPLPDYRVKTLIRQEHARVEQAIVRYEGHTLFPGNVVDIELDLESLPSVKLLYSSPRLLAVEKFPRIAVCDHPSITLTDLVRLQGYPDAQPCHRLDAGTGGVVLFALDDECLQWMNETFKEGSLIKEYEVIVGNPPSQQHAILEDYLLKDALHKHVTIYHGPHAGAVPIKTEYTLLQSTGELAKLQVILHTGRTHQIRAHLADYGHPVLGDDRYGSRALNQHFRMRIPCLWAQRILFPTIPQGEYSFLSDLQITSPAKWSEKIEGIFS